MPPRPSLAARRQVRDLASLAERALYDRVGDADADAAWQLSDQARQSALATAGWRKRLRRLLLPSRWAASPVTDGRGHAK